MCRARRGKQLPNCKIDKRVLNFYRSVGLDEVLELKHYIKESVGSTYDKTQYLPAIIQDDLAYSKFLNYFPKERIIDKESWSLTLDWLHEHLKPMGTVRTLKDGELVSNLVMGDLKGSCGYAFKGYKDKRDFIERSMSYYFREKLIFKTNPVALWNVFQKEELREGAKVLDEPSTRIVWGSSMFLFIAQFQLYHNLFKRFLEKRKKLWSSCGLDFCSMEYGQAMSVFKDQKVCSIDGTAFDASMQQQDIVDLFEVWNSFIENRDKNDEFYETLSYIMSNEIYSVAILPCGGVAQKECGNPSGSYLTLIRNTCHNFRLYAYVFIESCKKENIVPSYSYFKRIQKALMNGDDCIINKTRFINWKTIKEHLSKFLKITSVSHEGSHNIPLEVATYCGCTPVIINGSIVPVRNSYKLLLSLLFMNENDENLEQRVMGLMVANINDDLFVHTLSLFCRIHHFAMPNIGYLQSKYIYKQL